MTKTMLIEPTVPDPCTQLSLKPCRPELPQDTIRFTFCQPDSARTRLTVNNVLGEEIAVVVDSALCPDWYMYAWSTRKLTPGIYFVKLTSKGKQVAKKFIIHR